ncbi:hypothetical protein NECAME_18234, partial [Necator americanus]
VHNCLMYALEEIMEKTKCDDHELEHLSIASIDNCYQNLNLSPNLEIASVPVTSEVKELDVPTVEQEIKADVEKWSFGNSLIFAFTVITTIGE